MQSITICDSANTAAGLAAERLASLAQSGDDKFSIALAGGSTPKALYKILSAPPLKADLPWNRMRWYFGDERFVAPTDEQSNYRMARENLFIPAGVSDSHVFPVPTQAGDPIEVARLYDDILQRSLDKNDVGVPVFDLILLGMGDDGHTASLFPHTEGLKVQDRAVAANNVERLSTWRITLTIPVLLAARQVIVLITGESKATALWEVLEGSDNLETYPTQLLRSRSLPTEFIVDTPAAAKLSSLPQ